MPDPERPTDTLDELNLVNAGDVANLYERYRDDPASVEAEWRSLFDSGAGGYEPVRRRPSPPTGTASRDAPAPTRRNPVPTGARALTARR